MWKQVVGYSPSIIAVLIALSQIAITHTHGGLSADKGGGFGLFSTVDQLNNRSLNIYGQRGGQERLLNIDFFHPALKEVLPHRADARAFPTNAHLEALAHELIDRKIVDGLDSIRIEVGRVVFDDPSTQVTFERVNGITVSVAGRSGT